ncbi:MAG: HAMP domain-containing histidine kinase [Planctomycetaceae bacterium]|nr:HAMP domain-containing histidine kinase [Planctomycetaceae bacterium]
MDLLADSTTLRQGDEPAGIRWPIRWQLLVPMVAVVLLAVLSATAITAMWIASRVRQQQAYDLRRVAKTLGDAPFPLTGSVLWQMKGLSGAEFVLVDSRQQAEESTIPLASPWLDELARIAKAGHGSRESQAVVALGGRNYLVDRVDVASRLRAAAPSTLLILYPEDELASRVRQAVYPALIAGLVTAAIAVASATWLARRLARPIDVLVARTVAIARGDFRPMPVARRNDELRDLAESVNRMAQQLADYERQVRHNERLKTLGQLGASMAHQLRNAATGGRMAIELHRLECPKGAADESLDVALRQLRLMESYLRQFLSIDESGPQILQRVNATLLVQEVLGLVKPAHVHAGIKLNFVSPPEPVFLSGDPESLHQLVTNLVTNAADAAVAGTSSPPTVRVEIDRDVDGRGSIRVWDSGSGLDPAILDRLFDSFVTTKPDGFGLGLFVARQIAQRHGGQLRWRRDGAWTCFSFEFPLAGTTCGP